MGVVRTPVSGHVSVAYGQLYVESDPDAMAAWGFHDARAGQANGLCGAAVPGFLYLVTALHTGEVDFTVEVHEELPFPEDHWEEIVEVSFRPAGPETVLALWGGMGSFPLGLDEIDYRVRYCGSRLDEAVEREQEITECPGIEEHLLQFWPAPPAPDRLVKQTGDSSAYWHRTARALPSAERRAETRRRERAAQESRAREEREHAERMQWGGQLPSDRLRNVGGNIGGIIGLAPELAHALDRSTPEGQRSVARWAMRRAYEKAGLDGIDWIAPALDAAERGQPLPAPFDREDDHEPVWDRLLDDPRVPQTLVASTDGSGQEMLRAALAVPALFGAVEDDPLRAAVDALFAAAVAYGPDYGTLFTEARSAFFGELGPATA
ncbi:hypothetical protein AB0B50_33435 [Streptomyces sp. NPDC041068]|uniref:hypothetical protein n=1 Tax=Streptomyces sp. NPDC041068 TaxID=3155130 RepID=UPI0033C6BC56